MARAELRWTAGPSHSSQERSGGDKLMPSPMLEEEEDEIRACFPMLLLRQEPAGRVL